MEIYVGEIVSDGAFSYTPNAGFSGMDTFTYIASDGSNDSGVATATITVNAEQVLAVNNGMTVDEGSSDNTIATAMLQTTDVDNTGRSVELYDYRRPGKRHLVS